MTREEAQAQLWAGVRAGDVARVEAAVANSADLEVRDGSWTPLTLSASEGRERVVRPLVEAGADLEGRSSGRGTALQWAALNGHPSTVRALVEAGADPEGRTGAQSTALHLVAYKGHLDTVRNLVEAGADLNARDSLGRTPLARPVTHRCHDVVSYLSSLPRT